MAASRKPGDALQQFRQGAMLSAPVGLRRKVVVMLVLVLALSTGARCPGDKTSAEKLAEWAAKWSDDVARNRNKPNDFPVPEPPKVEFPIAAQDIGRDVNQAANEFSEEVGVALDVTQDVFCTWFDWYLETGTTVPDEDDFGPLLLEAGFNLVLKGPPNQQFQEAVNRFRSAIVAAQGETDTEIRNAAAAAACSVPEAP